MPKVWPWINKQLKKLFYFQPKPKTHHPFQACLKPRTGVRPNKKFFQNISSNLKNTDFGIHFLVNLASGVF